MQVFVRVFFLDPIKANRGGSSCYIVTLLIVFNTVFVKRMKGISLCLELNRVLIIMIFLVSDLGVG